MPTDGATASGDDRVAIQELLVHYCFLLDSGRPERIADEIFCADGVDDHGLGEWRGREGLRAGFVKVMEGFAGTAHVLANLHVELAGDTARARSYVTAWHWLPGNASDRPADLVIVGAYLDDLRRDPQGWRVLRRRFRPVGPSVVGTGTLPAFLQRRPGA